jgi:hypothetical protein
MSVRTRLTKRVATSVAGAALRRTACALALLLLGMPAFAAAPSKRAHAPASSGASIEVVVTLSKKAAARLAAAHEGIGLSASFFGTPTAAGRRRAGEDGTIALGNVERSLPATGRVRFAPPVYKKGLIELIEQRQPRVNINAFSARKTLPDNVLDCTFFEDSVAQAQAKPVSLRCKLIGEGKPRRAPAR